MFVDLFWALGIVGRHAGRGQLLRSWPGPIDTRQADIWLPG